MRPNPSPSRRRALSGAVARWCSLALSAALAGTAMGHDLFSAYILHRIALTLGARHLDVTVQLTFFEDGSEHEREHMDLDGDGRVSRGEGERYLAQLEAASAQAVLLRIGGQPAALTPLYRPELDLLGNHRVGRGHHRLTLHFFTTTPSNLPADAELTVEDLLWPGVRSLATMHVDGHDGAQLVALPNADPFHPPAHRGTPLKFRARLVVPPTVSLDLPDPPSSPGPATAPKDHPACTPPSGPADSCF